MRKTVLLLLCLLFILTACKQPDLTSSNPSDTLSGAESTPPDDSQDDPPDDLPDDPPDDPPDTGGSTEDNPDDPYALHNLADSRLTVDGDKKTYSDSGIAISVPFDWLCLERNGVNDSWYYFREPTLGEKCELYYHTTTPWDLPERTAEEYYLLFSGPNSTNVKIESLTKETLCGYAYTKVVSSYVSGGIEYIRIDYDCLVAGDRFHDFIVRYPASERDTYGPVFETIMESIVLTPSGDGSSDGPSTGEKEPDDPYPVRDIDDDRVTIEGDKKTYRDLGITVSIPVDWRCLEQSGEDGSSYFFRGPEADAKSQLSFYITLSDYARDWTEAEYLDRFAYSGMNDAKIESFTKETLSGYGCTKLVVSYTYMGTEYVRTYYSNVVTGFRMYEFTVTCLASERETLEPVFASVIDSIALAPL